MANLVRKIPPHVKGLAETKVRRGLDLQGSKHIRPGTAIRYSYELGEVYYRADGGACVESGRVQLPAQTIPETWRPLSLRPEDLDEEVWPPAVDRRGQLGDSPFEEASDVTSIQYRLHPIDVGFDLRAEGMPVVVGAEDTLRVSYANREGERRVMSGPRELVLPKLAALGYTVSEGTK